MIVPTPCRAVWLDGVRDEAEEAVLLDRLGGEYTGCRRRVPRWVRTLA